MKINENIAPCCGELRARCKVARGTSLNVRYDGIVSPYEMENSIQPHYPIRKYPLKIDFHGKAIQRRKKSAQHGADKIPRAVYKGGSIERFFSLPLQFRYGDDAASRLNEDTPLFIEGKHGARDLGRSGGIA